MVLTPTFPVLGSTRAPTASAAARRVLATPACSAEGPTMESAGAASVSVIQTGRALLANVQLQLLPVLSQVSDEKMVLHC